MPTVQVLSEQECPRGWTYTVRIDQSPDPANAPKEPTEHTIRLDWAEHELWCGGRCPPSRVIEVLLTAMIEADPARDLPDRFDAATVRRWWPEVDRIIPQRL